MPLQHSHKSRSVSKPLAVSASILAGIMATSGFSKAVDEQELDINQEDLRQLHEQYTALEESMEETKENDSADTLEEETNELTENELEELAYIKTQLIK